MAICITKQCCRCTTITYHDETNTVTHNPIKH